MSKNLKDYFYRGKWLMPLATLVFFGLFLMLIVADPKPEPLPKVQEVTLEDGTKCVVLKGISSDNAITCNWRK